MKKIYQYSGKCDDQQKFNDILEADMFSTPEEITDDSLILPMTKTTVNNQVLWYHCVHSPTYFLLKRELLSVMLELQNKNADPLNLDLAYGQIKQNEKVIQKSMIRRTLTQSQFCVFFLGVLSKFWLILTFMRDFLQQSKNKWVISIISA